MASRYCSKQLAKVLTTPSKVANGLDWRKATEGTIATIDVHTNRIGIRISQHPSNHSLSSQQCSYFLPIRTKGLRKIPDSSQQRLSDLVNQHNVCGFVVSWPLQKDTGLMGAACGRTLHAIEEILETSNSTSMKNVFSPSRPICLWNSAHIEQHNPDTFGRSPVYARTSSKKEHRASQEQYHQDESIVLCEVWEDFVESHWPEMQSHQQQVIPSRSAKKLSLAFNEWDAISRKLSEDDRPSMMVA